MAATGPSRSRSRRQLFPNGLPSGLHTAADTALHGTRCALHPAAVSAALHGTRCALHPAAVSAALRATRCAPQPVAALVALHGTRCALRRVAVSAALRGMKCVLHPAAASAALRATRCALRPAVVVAMVHAAAVRVTGEEATAATNEFSLCQFLPIGPVPVSALGPGRFFWFRVEVDIISVIGSQSLGPYRSLLPILHVQSEMTPPVPPMPDQPNFDRLDRIEHALDRLTERQEALSDSLELTHRDVDGLPTAVRGLQTATDQL